MPARKPDPRIRRVPTLLNDELLSESVRHAHLVEGWKLRQARKVARLINRRLLPPLVAQLDKLEGVSPSAERLGATVRNLQQISSVATRGIGQTMARDLTDLGVTEAAWQAQTLQRLVPLEFSFNTPSLAVLEQLTKKSAVQGRFLADWFEDIGTSAAGRAEGVLRRGFASGQSVPEMIRALRGTRSGGFTDGAIQATRREAATVVRTAATHVTAQAREAVYKANSDVIKGVRWVSTLDGRTSDICISLDGKVWKVGQGQRPPAHHQCRSTTVPVMESWDKFGVDASKVPEATRASMSGQVPASITYPQWLGGLSKDFQNQVLGKGRAELFRAGVPVERFLTKSLKPLSLTQIIRREGLTGVNLQSLTRAAGRDIATVATKAGSAAAERIRRAFGALPDGLREQIQTVTNAVKPLGKGIALATRGGAKLANVGPSTAQAIVRASGASKETVRKAMAVGIIGDWSGFLLAPVAPILGAVPPGSIVVSLFGLGKMGVRAVKLSSEIIAKITKNRTSLALAKVRATGKAKARAEAKKKRAAKRAVRTRRENKRARARLRRRAQFERQRKERLGRDA